LKNYYLFVFAALVAAPSAHAFNITETADYSLTGACQGQDGTAYGGDPNVASGEVTLTDISKSVFDLRSPITSAPVPTGPTDDGFQGCGLYVALMNCSSKRGTFVISPADQEGPFHTPTVLLSFTCTE